jgi:hypothetical protein
MVIALHEFCTQNGGQSEVNKELNIIDKELNKYIKRKKFIKSQLLFRQAK